MFLDQEIKFQAELRAEEMAKDLAQEKVIETAKNLIKIKLEPKQIAQATSLPIEQVLELKKQMEAK